MLKIYNCETCCAVIDGNNPINKDDSILFIPEYIYKGILEADVDFDYFINLIMSLPEHANPDHSYSELFKHYEDKPWREPVSQILDMAKKIRSVIGSEFENIWLVNQQVHNMLRMFATSNNSDFSEIFLYNVLGRGTYNFEEHDILNYLKCRRSTKFEDTFYMLDSEISLVILKEGFGDHVNKLENKITLVDKILDVKENYAGSKAYDSKAFTASINLKLELKK